jgi:hypothetical protein
LVAGEDQARCIRNQIDRNLGLTNQQDLTASRIDVTLMANQLTKSQKMPVRTAAWYEKELLTFADAIALVRHCLWRSCHSSTSSQSRDIFKGSLSLLERLTDTVSYAA